MQDAEALETRLGLRTKKGEEILVDEDIYRRFYNTPIAVHKSTGYPRLGTNVSLHQLVQPLPTGFDVIDHRNGNKLDNRRANLRPASWATNVRNWLPRSNTGHLGISKDPNGAHRAHVMTADGPITKRHRTIPAALAWKEANERIHHPEGFE
ncbi:uncharacterized protein PAN0_034d6284 [Moesziomyces antarcticus]|uniref:HNH nuclease domain-containing protein n=1 Tax=Pseudozyma antarctica TaxID=84753 RepID=A0A081CN07_PSEA2|nr:uncharacterized protein PAN0_034d6284 [Moesziomyces antarcticus]GAK68053.1 hypothetical protein PAN0_034d6284 [Moesziomyces antarcticus]